MQNSINGRPEQPHRRLGVCLDTYAAPPQTEYRYGNATRIAVWLKRLLWIDIAVSVIFLVASLSVGLVPPLGAFARMLLGLWALIFVIGGLFFLLWTYRAAANVHALGGDISFDPSWAVGWLIFPVVSVWMAFVVIEELWRASIDARDWQDNHAPWLVIYWWSAWVVASFGAVLVYFMQGGVIAKLVYFAGHIAYAWLLIPVIDRICDLQNAQASRLGFA